MAACPLCESCHPLSSSTSNSREINVVASARAFIEAESMADDPAEVAARLDQVEKDLGLATFDVVSLPYRDLVVRVAATR